MHLLKLTIITLLVSDGGKKRTVYSVQCTVYSVQCTVYSVQCTVYSVQCTVYSVQCTVYSVQCTVYSVQCTVYSVQCTVYTGSYNNHFDFCRQHNLSKDVFRKMTYFRLQIQIGRPIWNRNNNRAPRRTPVV